MSIRHDEGFGGSGFGVGEGPYADYDTPLWARGVSREPNRYRRYHPEEIIGGWGYRGSMNDRGAYDRGYGFYDRNPYERAFGGAFNQAWGRDYNNYGGGYGHAGFGGHVGGYGHAGFGGHGVERDFGRFSGVGDWRFGDREERGYARSWNRDRDINEFIARETFYNQVQNPYAAFGNVGFGGYGQGYGYGHGSPVGGAFARSVPFARGEGEWFPMVDRFGAYDRTGMFGSSMITAQQVVQAAQVFGVHPTIALNVLSTNPHLAQSFGVHPAAVQQLIVQERLGVSPLSYAWQQLQGNVGGIGTSAWNNGYGVSPWNAFGNVGSWNTIHGVTPWNTIGNNVSDVFGMGAIGGIGSNMANQVLANQFGLNNTFGLNGLNNTFGLNGLNNTFGLNGMNGTFGLNGLNNTFGLNGLNNTFGLNGMNNVHGLNNTFGLNNVLGLNNTFGLNNVLGLNNTFGRAFGNGAIVNALTGNTFGSLGYNPLVQAAFGGNLLTQALSNNVFGVNPIVAQTALANLVGIHGANAFGVNPIVAQTALANLGIHGVNAFNMNPFAIQQVLASNPFAVHQANAFGGNAFGAFGGNAFGGNAFGHGAGIHTPWTTQDRFGAYDRTDRVGGYDRTDRFSQDRVGGFDRAGFQGGFDAVGPFWTGAEMGFGGDERGPHYGRGPKGYKRADDRIREEVCELISRIGFVDASDVEIVVESGVVRLTGSVAWRRDKRVLEQLIERVYGVEEVRNELRLTRRDSDFDRYASKQSTQQVPPNGKNARV